ncbi:hemerythrin domain-containing protein [Sorangium sp. So ce131]|uniref:hemerythrin domain-containing protein n=1 Tax=Sorangium sp. So ce131 TaxID=3133282 RepID=UPI003F5E8C7B
MLHTIRTRPLPEQPADAVDLLLACHQRIRRFTAAALRLPGAEGAPADEVVETAAALRRYFTVALPAHAADEDYSVRPRLLDAGAPAEVRDALAEAAAQHEAIDAVIAELAADWRRVADAPARLKELSSTLGERAARLDVLFGAHLALEERTIFPAARRALSSGVQRQILDEMRARRPAFAVEAAERA